MTGTAASTVARVTRWLLLACTVLGLTAMHTLGHAGMASSDRHTAAAMSDRYAAVVASDWHAAVVASDWHAAVVASDWHAAVVASDRYAAAAPASVVPSLVAAASAVPSLVAAEECAGDHCPAGHGMADGWSVCLAILTGLAAAVLLAIVLVAVAGGPAAQRVPGLLVSRAPPRRLLPSILTATTVLRI